MEDRTQKKIGVLAGGPSSEREISLRSGRAVYNALIARKLDAVFCDVHNGGDVFEALRRYSPDAVFIALHGRFGEDGTVQRILEDAGIPYTGSGVEASRLALDKIASKERFTARGIPVPRYCVLEKASFSPETLKGISPPVVVKPQNEGSSIGLSVVKERTGLDEAVDRAFSYDPKVIVEEYIDGRELTVGILDDKPLPVIEIMTKYKVYDYRAKYQDPSTEYLVPAPIEKDIYDRAQTLGQAAHAALGCRYFSRVDMRVDGSGQIFVLEVNTIPGMTQRSLLPKAAQARGISFNELCLRIVDGAF